jgi:hypothetical protein
MKKLSEIVQDNDRYAISSKEKLSFNLESKFKKVFGGALYHIEVFFRNEISDDPKRYRDLRSAILRLGNDSIRNMMRELESYNVYFIPFHMELKSLEVQDNDGQEG